MMTNDTVQLQGLLEKCADADLPGGMIGSPAGGG